MDEPFPFKVGDLVDVIDLRDGCIVDRHVEIKAIEPSDAPNTPYFVGSLSCGYRCSLRCLLPATVRC